MSWKAHGKSKVNPLFKLQSVKRKQFKENTSLKSMKFDKN